MSKQGVNVMVMYSGEIHDVVRDVLEDLLSKDARHTLSHQIIRSAEEAERAGFTETAAEFRALAPLVWKDD